VVDHDGGELEGSSKGVIVVVGGGHRAGSCFGVGVGSVTGVTAAAMGVEKGERVDFLLRGWDIVKQ
jgi:hypothetical protein